MVFVLTKFEREILSSDQKRKSVAPQTVRNTMQRIRNKASKAIEDLLFIGDTQRLQLAQVLGFTRSGKRWGRTEWGNGETIQLIDSKTLLKRFDRAEKARRLAVILALNAGIIDEWNEQKRLDEAKAAEKEKIVDLQKLGVAYPKIVIALLQNQFQCPKCGKAGLIFYGKEHWLWMHYNQNDRHPKATFCNIGKKLPEKFVEFPFMIQPQHGAFGAEVAELGPNDKLRFFT